MTTTPSTQATTSLRERDLRGDAAFPHEPLDVLVVGAGQAGLALAWHLGRRGVRYLLVDAAAELGHSWRSRWDSLRLFTPSRYDGLPGTPFPAPPDSHPTKDEVADYLAAYAQEHDVPVLTSTRVTRLCVTPEGFTAHTVGGVIRARQVVVATGAFHRPHVPSIDGHLDPAVPQLHSSQYRNPASVPGGRVLVVGAGNSGLQIAEELVRDRDVVVSAGSHPVALPQRLAGRDLFWWLDRLGAMRKPADSRLARRIRARGDLVIGTNRKHLARAGVDFRDRLVAGAGRTVRFADASTAEIDAVVWATGFRPDYGWIEADVTDARGDLRHDQGRTVVDGLWTIGQQWQRTRGSALLGFVQHDAADLAARLDVTSAAVRT